MHLRLLSQKNLLMKFFRKKSEDIRENKRSVWKSAYGICTMCVE